MPTVPGAIGDNPLPKPSAMTCAGCDSRKRHVGLRGAFATGGFNVGVGVGVGAGAGAGAGVGVGVMT